MLVVLPGTVDMSGCWSEGLAASVGVSEPEVVLLSAPISAQHPVSLVQLHKLAVEARVGGVAVWMQLQRGNKDML